MLKFYSKFINKTKKSEKMRITYLPNLGIEIYSEKILWNESRQNIRVKLKQSHKDDDKEIDNSDFFDGDKSFNIIQKVHKSNHLVRLIIIQCYMNRLQLDFQFISRFLLLILLIYILQYQITF